MPYSLITEIKRILLEDAGLSADGVATNSAGAGKVDGIGVGPRGEPGMDPRRRRRRRLLRRRRPDRDLDDYRIPEDSDLDRALRVPYQVVELSDYDEQGNFIGVDDELGLLEKFKTDQTHPAKRVLHPRKEIHRTRDAGKIVVNPELGKHVKEDRVRSGGKSHVEYLIRIGLGDPSRMNYYRQAITDPDRAVRSPVLRPYVAGVLERTLSLLFDDAQFYRRFATVLREKGKKVVDEELEDCAPDRHLCFPRGTGTLTS